MGGVMGLGDLSAPKTLTGASGGPGLVPTSRPFRPSGSVSVYMETLASEAWRWFVEPAVASPERLEAAVGPEGSPLRSLATLVGNTTARPLGRQPHRASRRRR